MAVELYKSVDRTKIDSLPFIKGTHAFGYVDAKQQSRLGIVYEIGVDDCKKIRSLFKGKTEKQIVKGDRVFVLSGCKVPQFKIKEFCRSVGAIMVPDIETATVFVGNERVFQKDSIYDAPTQDSLSMIMSITYMQATHDPGVQNPTSITREDVLDDYYPGKITEARFTKFLASKRTEFYIGGTRQMCCITPYTARVVYEILANQIVTITESCLLSQLPTAATLDKATFEQLMSMLNSPDEANQKMAHEILANCNYTDAHLYLYQIARPHYYQITSSRYKNVRLFVKEAGLSFYYTTGEEKFLKFLHKKNQLNKEALEYALPIISRRFNNGLENIKSSMFNIKIELREELSDLLGEHDYNKEMKPISLNTETDE